MIAPQTLAQRLAGARLPGLLTAVEGTLKPLFPGVSVRTLAGKVDMSDVVEGSVFAAPAIAVTLTRWRAPPDVSGGYALEVDLAAYVVTEETVVGARAVRREAVAHALTAGLIDILADDDASRWGLRSISAPQAAEARPVFTAESYAKGTAYYAVTWRQSLVEMRATPLARMPYGAVESIEDGTVTGWPEDLSGAPA